MAQKTVFLRSQFNYDTEEASNETGLTCPEETLTQQHQKEEADINTIIHRFKISGQMPDNVRIPQYGDFTDVPNDYHQAANFVRAANEAFMKYPAHIRDRFKNDAGEFLDFMHDAKNLDEAIALGIVQKPTVETVPVTPAATTAETKPTAAATTAETKPTA